MEVSNSPSTVNRLPLVICLPAGSITVNFILSKGIISEVSFSDYQEVEGLYFPFSMSQGEKDKPGQPITFTTIEVNPEFVDADFAFPAKK